MAELREIATGLRFPEGPVALGDGAIVVVEIAGRAITRVEPDGSVEVLAEPGGGPNGAAIGPDGKLYVCNNGASFDYVDMEGLNVPVQPPSAHEGGRIERVDLDSGEVEVLYTECEGRPLRAPNDLVFDAEGGFYFTDHGLREHRTSDRTGVFYAQPDGSSIDEVHHSDHYLPRGPGYGLLPLPAGRWTPAHTEAARFLGECFAVGAVLGLVVEMARPMGGQRHG